ncbi:hypothetical protein A3D77_04265 [Candidatus Gottesmanbacteria bacterium RIFCSPHIGHO2_02_FULL_39_11]|uniref:ANTAR domain-containing protein n=1 Tax=Candidatus Gottesmanbacteria bacterium RIFCSPHIGHO2_02_FULL_39_11 TaxID=1798382 RepID=A0A1F5ZKB5_9BACT|nr:MAG: hypothetical protein A3D77_04265 [Candidatus Gottesmanbacteria bacterium RIFCSPHIGHO2_02_FULL_39_11]
MLQKKQIQKELEILYKVAQSVHSLEIGELLEELAHIVDEISQADSILIYILDPKKNELILRSSKNPHSNLLKKIKIKLGEGITGWVAQEKKMVVLSQNAYKDSRFKHFSSLPEDTFEAFLSVPIMNKKGILGVINVQHKKPHVHSVSEINLLSAIGKLVGGAVDNALLVEESLSLKEALEMRKIVEKAKGILMKRKNLSEDEAFKLIQKESMNSRKSIKEIAEIIILAQKIYT